MIVVEPTEVDYNDYGPPITKKKEFEKVLMNMKCGKATGIKGMQNFSTIWVQTFTTLWYNYKNYNDKYNDIMGAALDMSEWFLTK